jgi:hypothetical protein
MNTEAFMIGPLPEKPSAAQMDRATRYGLLSVKYQIWVGEVDRKEGIVLFHGGTEEHRTLRLHQQIESG